MNNLWNTILNALHEEALREDFARDLERIARGQAEPIPEDCAECFGGCPDCVPIGERSDCPAALDGFFCTLDAGHGGSHVAHGYCPDGRFEVIFK